MVRKRQNEIGTVLLDGFYGHRNAGDEAILSSLVQQIRTFDPQSTIVVSSEDPPHTERHHDVDWCIERYTPSDGVPSREWMNTVRMADQFWIGGGGLFGEKKLLKYAIPVAIARTTGTRVATVAVGSGPFAPDGNRLAAPMLSQADAITVRDTNTAKELRRVDVTAPIEIVADPVFGYDFDSRGVSLPPELQGVADSKSVIVSVREPADRRVDSESLSESLTEFARERSARVVFVPFHNDRSTTSSDADVSSQIADRIDDAVETLVWDDELAHDQLLRVIACSRLVVGMRLHSIIFAAKVRTPFVGIPYSPKCVAHLEQLRVPTEFSCEDLDSKRLTTEIRERWKNGISPETAVAIDEREATARQIVSTIQSTSTREPGFSVPELGAKIGVEGVKRLF